MPRALGFVFALVIVLVLAGVPAATQDQQTPPVFRAGTDLVQLDVTVLDRDRHPVHGLTAADFVVLEDGKPRPVSACSAIDVPAPAIDTAAWTRDVPPDVVTNDLHTGRVIVIVFDDALIPFQPLYAKQAKDIARQVINKLGPNDVAAFVATADNRLAQDFTHDRARLLDSVERISPGIASYTFGNDNPPVPGLPTVVLPNTDVHFYDQTVMTLRSAAEMLVEVPNQRKALVYIGPGVPIDMQSAAPQLVSGTGKGLPDAEANRQLIEELNETIRKAQQANVTFYPIDPTGTAGIEPFVLGVLTSRKVPGAEDIAHNVGRNDLDFLEAAAADTGGIAMVNRDDVSGGIAQMFEETGVVLPARLPARASRRRRRLASRHGQGQPAGRRGARAIRLHGAAAQHQTDGRVAAGRGDRRPALESRRADGRHARAVRGTGRQVGRRRDRARPVGVGESRHGCRSRG